VLQKFKITIKGKKTREVETPLSGLELKFLKELENSLSKACEEEGLESPVKVEKVKSEKSEEC